MSEQLNPDYDNLGDGQIVTFRAVIKRDTFSPRLIQLYPVGAPLDGENWTHLMHRDDYEALAVSVENAEVQS